MDLEAQKALSTLFDPGQPYIYLLAAPVAGLIALGRPKLATLWAVVMGAVLFIG